MFARVVENLKVKCNENLSPSMEDQGRGDDHKALRRQKVRELNHG